MKSIAHFSTGKEFVRATGLAKEGRRRCLAGVCGKVFAVIGHETEITCPYCGGTATEVVDMHRKNEEKEV